MRTALLAIVVFGAVVANAAAQAPAGTTPPPPPESLEEARASARVPVPEPSPEAVSYYRSGNVLWIVDTIWGFVLPIGLLATGFSARLRTWAGRIGRTRVLTIALYFAAFSVVTFLIGLPLSYYESFVREHAYGLSNQTFGKWAQDQLIGLAVGIVAGGLFLWVPYTLLRRSPGRWWLYTGLAAIPFIVLLVFVAPIWIDPLFNRFGPMANEALEADILALADRAGIEGGRVFEVAKSEDTKAVNAYVNGFGSTKRIVLWDTIIAKLTREQLLVVMGHEMGHYVLGHVWKLILIFSALTIGSLYVVHRASGWLIARYRHRFGFTELGDVASLPLILVLSGAASFTATPLALAVQRHFEHEADRFGLEITRDNRAAATAFVTLQQENLAVPRPGPLYKWWRASHPLLGERIDFSNDYRPWERNEPLVYGHLFRER